MTERRFKPKHMKKLDNPERRKLLPPHKLLELLEIQDNDILIDLGAGTGYLPSRRQVSPGTKSTPWTWNRKCCNIWGNVWRSKTGQCRVN